MAASGTDWFQEYGSAITTIASGVISYVVSYFTAKRVAARSAGKEAFCEILEKLDEIESTAEQLLLTPAADQSAHRLSRSINVTDARLGRRLTEVFRAQSRRMGTTALEPVPLTINRARIELRQFVTDMKWLQTDRPALPANDPSFDNLRARVETLRQAIREEAEDMNLGDLQ